MTGRRETRLLCLLHLLLLLVPSAAAASSSSSSNLNNSHHHQTKKNSSKTITHLPGFDGPLPFQLQTGYVEVDASHGVRLFYYFIRSERKPEDDSVMLWLTGGPGCSAFSGLVYEIGLHSIPRPISTYTSSTTTNYQYPMDLSLDYMLPSGAFKNLILFSSKFALNMHHRSCIIGSTPKGRRTFYRQLKVIKFAPPPLCVISTALSVSTATPTLMACLSCATNQTHGPRFQFQVSTPPSPPKQAAKAASFLFLWIARASQVSNVIFLDSPVGTGFSYSKTEQGYKSSDTKAVSQIVIFLTKWFDERPEFLSNPLYIAGDSYCGMIVPAITLQIAKGKEVGDGAALNLKGYLVGNPVTDESFDKPSKIPFAHGMGLISDEMYQVKLDRGSLITTWNHGLICL